MLFGHFYVTFILCTSSTCLVFFILFFTYIRIYIYVCACVRVCVLGFVLLNSTKVKMQPK